MQDAIIVYGDYYNQKLGGRMPKQAQQSLGEAGTMVTPL